MANIPSTRLPTLNEIKENQTFNPNYIVVILKDSKDNISIEHIVTYESIPTKEDMDLLKEEINTGEEFGFLGKESELEYILLTADEYNDFVSKMEN